MGDENLTTTGRRKKKSFIWQKKKMSQRKWYGFGTYKFGDRSAQERAQEYMTLKKLRNSGDSGEANSVASS